MDGPLALTLTLIEGSMRKFLNMENDMLERMIFFSSQCSDLLCLHFLLS